MRLKSSLGPVLALALAACATAPQTPRYDLTPLERFRGCFIERSEQGSAIVESSPAPTMPGSWRIHYVMLVRQGQNHGLTYHLAQRQDGGWNMCGPSFGGGSCGDVNFEEDAPTPEPHAYLAMEGDQLVFSIWSNGQRWTTFRGDRRSCG